MVAQQLGISVKDDNADAALKLLAAKFNSLLDSDFNRLVSVLYRLDIPEEKLKEELRMRSDEDAGLIIAGLAIERQAQKIRTRNEYKPKDGESSDAERW